MRAIKFRNWLPAFVFLSSLSCALSAPISRLEFARAMAKIKVGMSSNEVVSILGRPDDVRTIYDEGGLRTYRTAEIWGYGAQSHMGFPTLGSISIDTNGCAQYIYGGKGEPPAPDMFTEEQLRKLLVTIDKTPLYDCGWEYNPLLLIQTVNTLQPLGKEKALAAMEEYLRVSDENAFNGRDGLFLV